MIRPAAALRHQSHGFLDLPPVGVATLDHRDRYTVRAENDLRPLGLCEARQGAVDGLYQRVQVAFVAIEVGNTVHASAILAISAVPLIQAAAGRGA